MSHQNESPAGHDSSTTSGAVPFSSCCDGSSLSIHGDLFAKTHHIEINLCESIVSPTVPAHDHNNRFHARAERQRHSVPPASTLFLRFQASPLSAHSDRSRVPRSQFPRIRQKTLRNNRPLKPPQRTRFLELLHLHQRRSRTTFATSPSKQEPKNMQQLNFIPESTASTRWRPTTNKHAGRSTHASGWRDRQPIFLAIVDAVGRQDRAMKRAYSLPISTNVNKIFWKTFVAVDSPEVRGWCAATTRTQIVISADEVDPSTRESHDRHNPNFMEMPPTAHAIAHTSPKPEDEHAKRRSANMSSRVFSSTASICRWRRITFFEGGDISHDPS